MIPPASCRTEGNHIPYLQLAIGGILGGVESQTDLSDRPAASAASTNARMRRVQFADHHLEHAVQLVRGVRARDQRSESLAHRLPVDTVEFRVEEIIVEVLPRLGGHLGFLVFEIHIHVARNRKGALVPVAQSEYRDSSLIQVEKLFAIGRNLHSGFRRAVRSPTGYGIFSVASSRVSELMFPREVNQMRLGSAVICCRRPS